MSSFNIKSSPSKTYERTGISINNNNNYSSSSSSLSPISTTKSLHIIWQGDRPDTDHMDDDIHHNNHTSKEEDNDNNNETKTQWECEMDCGSYQELVDNIRLYYNVPENHVSITHIQVCMCIYECVMHVCSCVSHCSFIYFYMCV